MKRLIFIALALIIPIIIWWVESKIAKRKGEQFSGPSVLMLFGIAVSIFILIVGLFFLKPQTHQVVLSISQELKMGKLFQEALKKQLNQ